VDILHRAQKDLGGEVLSRVFIADPEKDVAVDGRLAALIDLGERFRVSRFGSLDEHGFVGHEHHSERSTTTSP